MAITIKELLAADTISQAADKINFNFDQLLLNGGGPVGPPGPFGPPGPIGGRGLRGSVWFEGFGDPNLITIPDAEVDDQYLEGPITTAQTGDGDVWEFNGTSWIWTGINIKGDEGSPGTSEDWGSFGQPLLTTGNSLYPVFPPPASKPALNDVRAVTIGGIPTTLGGVGNYAIQDAFAEQFSTSDSSLYVHTPEGPTVSSIKFTGGALSGTPGGYTDNVNQCVEINLLPDDLFQLYDQKNPGVEYYGINIESKERGVDIKAGREILMTSGLGTMGPFAPNSDITPYSGW